MRRASGATNAPEFVVARGLGDVDRVLDAIDHIEIVSREGGTEERLLIAQAQHRCGGKWTPSALAIP